MDNVFYFKSINKIGGTEQFLYEIAKKYHEYDITVYYDSWTPSSTTSSDGSQTQSDQTQSGSNSQQGENQNSNGNSNGSDGSGNN